MGFFDELFDDILGFDPPDVKIPPIPTPPPPTEKVSGQASDEILKRRFARRRGRAKTIVTGDLSPETPGKVNLLGLTV